VAREIRERVETVLKLPLLESRVPAPHSAEFSAAARDFAAGLERTPHRWGILLGRVLISSLEKMRGDAPAGAPPPPALREWGLEGILSEALGGLGRDAAGASRDLAALGIISILGQTWGFGHWWMELAPPRYVARRILGALCYDEGAKRILGFNHYQEALYLSKEALEDLTADLLAVAALELELAQTPDAKVRPDIASRLAASHAILKSLLEAAAVSGYQVDAMREALSKLGA
jgi:hypothetical protein